MRHRLSESSRFDTFSHAPSDNNYPPPPLTPRTIRENRRSTTAVLNESLPVWRQPVERVERPRTPELDFTSDAHETTAGASSSGTGRLAGAGSVGVASGFLDGDDALMSSGTVPLSTRSISDTAMDEPSSRAIIFLQSCVSYVEGVCARSVELNVTPPPLVPHTVSSEGAQSTSRWHKAKHGEWT